MSMALPVSSSFLLGLLIAMLVAVLPAARHDGAFSILLWLACAGSGALVLGPTLLGARTLLSKSRVLFPMIAALAMASGPVMVFGRLIKTATHHRPLGAMTYSVIACIVVVCAWVFAWRLDQVAHDAQRSMLSRSARWVLASLSVASLLVALFVMRAVGGALAPVVVDTVVVLVLAAAVLKFGVDLTLQKVPPGVVWPLWGLMVGAGVWASLELGPSAMEASVPLSALAALVTP